MKQRRRKSKNQKRKQKNNNSHFGGDVIGQFGQEAKQPNSGIRKCVRVKLTSSGKEVSAYVPHDGGLFWADEDDPVLLQRYSRRIGDIPGVKYKVIKVWSRGLKATVN